MAPKGVGEGWFSTTNGEMQYNTDSISVGVSNFTNDTCKRQPSGEHGSDDEASICCFPRGRSMSRIKGDVLVSNLLDIGGAGTPAFAKLNPDESKVRSPRSRPIDTVLCCCCGPSKGLNYTVEVRSVDSHNDRISQKQSELRTQGRWEVDMNEEYYKPPVWKQLLRKVKAHARQVHSSRCDWENYDLQSYENNFDNGGWRDQIGSTCAGQLDEKEDLGTKERALHTALLQKFASSRSNSQLSADGGSFSPIFSPLPVRILSKEEIDKSKEDFVPIWQRRATPPIKLDLRQRSV